MAVDDPHIFSQLLENPRHSQLTTKGVAIGANMTGKNEFLMRKNALSQKVPIQGHILADAAFGKWLVKFIWCLKKVQLTTARPPINRWRLHNS